MKRAVIAAIAAVLVVPVGAHAQGLDLDGPAWGPRLRITPFMGFAPTLTRTERWAFVGPGFTATDVYHVDLASGLAGGVTVEMQLIERFAVMGSATWISRGITLERSDETSTRIRHPGSNFLFMKAALAMRLRERVSDIQVHSLSGTLFVGPALVREIPKADPNAPNPVLLEPLTYTGITFGLDLQLPLLTEWMTFQAGVEDTFFHWDDAEMARRNDIAAGGSLQSYVESDPSHTFIFRAGLSLRVR